MTAAHMEALPMVTPVLALASLVASGFIWLCFKRTQRKLDALRQLKKQTIVDAWRGGLEQAANVVATLAERPYDHEPAFGALLHAEAIIHEQIRALSRAGEEQVKSR